MDGGAWWAIVHGVVKSRTLKSDLASLSFAFTLYFTLYCRSVVKNLPAEQETQVRSRQENPLEKDSNPLQYSCLENPMDGGAW